MNKCSKKWVSQIVHEVLDTKINACLTKKPWARSWYGAVMKREVGTGKKLFLIHADITVGTGTETYVPTCII